MKYPLGVQDFSKIIERGALYIDKTAQIQNVVEGYEMIFLSRPRRFGKSLLISTLAALFSGKKTLFDGLAISRNGYKFPQHPVIEFTFSQVLTEQADDFKAYIINKTNRYAQQFDITLTVDSYEQRFAQLIENLPKRAVLLIDEYDKPLLDNLDNAEVLTSVKKAMNGFYSTIKALDRHLQFVLITGVSRFSKISVFSAMNNLVDISMHQQYSTLCGITQIELEQTFNHELSDLAVIEGVDKSVLLKKIKYWYNGYRFHQNSETVYNPYSLLSLFEYREFKFHWFATATPTFLINLIKKRQFNLAQVTELEVDEGAFLAIEPEKMSPLPVLLQTGYLTIADYNNGRYKLDYPNYEVKHAFHRAIVEQFSHAEDVKSGSVLQALCQAIAQDDMAALIKNLQVLFANIPYDIVIKDEHYYHSLFYAIFVMLGYEIEAEVRTNNGRIDCVLQSTSSIYVIEFKLDISKEKAIQQVKDKQYLQKYLNTDKALVALGIEFSSTVRNIVGYLRLDVVRGNETFSEGEVNTLRYQSDSEHQFYIGKQEDANAQANIDAQHNSDEIKPQNLIVDLGAMPTTPEEVIGRDKEIELLNQAWENNNTRTVSVVGMGGMGKSSLVNAWLNQMATDNFKGAECVFAHSFYSQGTSNQQKVSAEHFLQSAFRFLEFTGELPSSSHEQGIILAKLFCQYKTLLVIDGLEPLQHPPGVNNGALKSQAMASFFKTLAYNLNGLCVITSRAPVIEMKSSNINLESLSIEDGVQLLLNRGVKGTEHQLKNVVHKIHGHALTLSLLGSYLAAVYDGDINKQDSIINLMEEENEGEHARYVMASYEAWLGQSDKPDLDILYILSLFNRPVSKPTIDMLIDADIEGISDKLSGLSNAQWGFAIQRLQKMQLIHQVENQHIDCHPLVREYFCERLKSQSPDGVKAAHQLLYEYDKTTGEKELPDDIE